MPNGHPEMLIFQMPVINNYMKSAALAVVVYQDKNGS